MIVRTTPPPAAIILFLLLIVAAIFPPFVPLLGPLSVDDLMPLAALLVVFGVLPLRRGPLPIDATVLGFLLLSVFALASSALNAESISDFARLAGRSAGRVMFYQALVIGVRVLLDDGRWPRRAVVFLAGAATVEALFAIWAYQSHYSGPFGFGVVSFADWSVLAGRTRVQGTFGGAQGRYEANNVSANFLAGYLVMAVPATLGLLAVAKKKLGRAVASIAIGLQVVSLYLTYTRAALVALGIGVLCFGFLIGKKRLAAAVIVVGVAMVLAVPSMRSKFFSEGHDRWALFWASAAITADHAIAGVGDGNYDRVLHENQRYHDTPYGVATTTSHNSVLLSAAALGLGGGAAHLILYALVVLVALRAVRRAEGRDARLLAAAVASACIAFLAQDQLNNLAYVPKVATQFWFLVGLLPLVARARPIQARLDPPAASEVWHPSVPAHQEG